MKGSHDGVTVAVRVKPGSRAPRVGGVWGDPPELVVAVSQRAVDGAANKGVVAALAAALGVPESAVTLRRGVRSRSKLVWVCGPRQELQARVEELRRN